MPDPQLLAEALVLLLAQALPTLVTAGEKAAGKAVEEVCKQAGAAASGKVKEIWERLRGKVEEKEAAKDAVEDLVEDPDDTDRHAALRRQLVKILTADPDLAALLEPLVEEANRTEVTVTRVRTGKRGIAVGRDVHGPITIHNITPAAAPATPSDRTDPAALRRAYLTRLMEQVGVLSLAGIDPAAAGGEAEARLSLDAVYTALRTRSPEEDPEGKEVAAEPRPHVSALEQLNRHLRLVLLGDPGGGKSTFVQFVALCHAGEALRHPQVNLKLLRAPLPSTRGEKKQKPQPWKHGCLLPVRVVLRDFAARGLPPANEPVTALHLRGFLERDLKDAALEDYIPAFFKELQEEGGLLLFDGLDEVPEAESRRDRLRLAVEEFVRSFGKCRVLVTSRTYAYRSQGWRLGRFAETELAPFDEVQIQCFVERWYDQVAATGRLGREEAQGRAQLLLQAVLGSDRLRGLAERPLLLTLMASLHAWRGGSLPEKREQLYADAVELLLNLWESQRVIRDPDGTTRLMQPSLAQYLDIGKDQVRQVLEELAFEVHARGDLAGTADVPEGELVVRLMRLGRKPGTNPAELVEYLSQRAGLLVPRGIEVYTFPHRTFQEYLAACHLTTKGFPRELAELGRRDPGRWREVVLLAGAKAARGAPFATWSLAERLCPGEPADCNGPDDVWGAHLAGQVIAESADLENLDETDRKKLERLQRWHDHLLATDLLPARERALAGKTLARLGDPRFDPERGYLPREPLLGFIEVPAGKFVMGSDESEHYIFGKESPRHEVELPRYFISRFPVTVAQYRAFVESTGYTADPASFNGVANHPVRDVSFHDALAYCVWLQERLAAWGWLEGGWKVTLPSEAEWERAARGEDGWRYPWGEDADPERANYDESGISEPSTVGCFPCGKSPYGCEEMSGNVWEWTRSLWGTSGSTYEYPYDKGDGREDLEASPEVLRVLRGGAFYFDSRGVRCAFRYSFVPGLRFGFVGFRLVLLPFSSDL
jgi:formylglycine-generating enzyme required for sulfatase activity